MIFIIFKAQKKLHPLAFKIYHDLVNQLNPVHIQVGAMEFMRDSVVSTIKKTIEQRGEDEIAEFKKFLSDKVITL